ncbi:hypothetical protein D3C81_682800 [compost metagenome]
MAVVGGNLIANKQLILRVQLEGLRRANKQISSFIKIGACRYFNRHFKLFTLVDLIQLEVLLISLHLT